VFHVIYTALMTPESNPSALTTIGNTLAEARRLRHLTQDTVAQAAGISRRALIAIEAGGDCMLSTMRKLCGVLDLDIRVVDHSLSARPTLDDVTEENRSVLFDRPKG